MNLLVKDSGLHGLKASIGYCEECQKPQVHYTTANGWPICHVCGYNSALEQLFADEPASHASEQEYGAKAA